MSEQNFGTLQEPDHRTEQQKVFDAENAQRGQTNQQFTQTQRPVVHPQGAVKLQEVKRTEVSTDPAEIRLVLIETQLAEVRSELKRMGARITGA